MEGISINQLVSLAVAYIQYSAAKDTEEAFDEYNSAIQGSQADASLKTATQELTDRIAEVTKLQQIGALGTAFGSLVSTGNRETVGVNLPN